MNGQQILMDDRQRWGIQLRGLRILQCIQSDQGAAKMHLEWWLLDGRLIAKDFTPRVCFCKQGCIFRLTCSHPELTKDHVLKVRILKFLELSQEMPKIRVSEGKKRLFLTSLKQTCNEYLYSNIKISKNRSMVL